MPLFLFLLVVSDIAAAPFHFAAALSNFSLSSTFLFNFLNFFLRLFMYDNVKRDKYTSPPTKKVNNFFFENKLNQCFKNDAAQKSPKIVCFC